MGLGFRIEDRDFSSRAVRHSRVSEGAQEELRRIREAVCPGQYGAFFEIDWYSKRVVCVVGEGDGGAVCESCIYNPNRGDLRPARRAA